MASLNKTITATTHPDYDDAAPYLKAIRDSVIGSPAIKREKYVYLPHPSQVDQTSPEARQRYTDFLAGAEFESYVDDTRRSLLGKMRISKSKVEMPDALDYLVDNIDGDGKAFASAIEYGINNVLQTKWHVLVSEFKGAPKDDTPMSKADAKNLKMRSVIKQYTRESVVDWAFSVVDGVKQLSYIKFLEWAEVVDQVSGNREYVQKYLILGLDTAGNYYQVTYEDGNEPDIDDRDYPTVDDKSLRMIPVTFLADEELDTDCLPAQLGFLWGVTDSTLSRYRVSAVYKETQRNMAPTMFTSGWKQGDIDIFKEANNERSVILTGAGAVNNMPDGVEVNVVSAAAEMLDFHWYFETNEKKIKAKGGDTGNEVKMTATEADINANKENSLLNTVADSADEAFTRASFLCGVFEGAYTLDEASYNKALEEIIIELPRDFATPKLTDEEVTQYREDFLMGLITKEQYIKIMMKGGRRDGDIDELLAEIEEMPPVGVVG